MIADRVPYPAYEDSQVPWLGAIPKHWDIMPIKRAARLNPSKTELAERLKSDESATFLPMERVGINGDVDTTEVRPVSSMSDGFTYFRRGDVLVAKITPCFENGKGAHLQALPTEIGFGSTEFIVLRPSDDLLPGYLYRISTLPEFRVLGAEAMTGAAGQQRVPNSFVANFPMVVPSLEEQHAIVRFLLFAEQKIWRAIRAKQKLIKMLEEQKQAIVHHAVTRGLDPNVRLKPSGVEWLGDVPAHWGVRRLRNVVTCVTSGSRGWSSFAADLGPRFIRIANLTRDSVDLDFSDTVRLNLPIATQSETKRARIRPDDLLISITAFIGSVAVAPHDIEEAYVSQHVACCRPAPGANARWLAYVLLSPVGQIHGQLCMYGGTKQGLSLDDVKNYIVLLPPRDEQDSLVVWIESQIRAVATAIASAGREIDLLRELQTRLVADVVTGKLDVRDAAKNLPGDLEDPGSADKEVEPPVGFAEPIDAESDLTVEIPA